MARLAPRELTRLLDFLRDCYAVRDHDGFARHVVRAMPGLIPADITSYNELNPGGRMLRWIWNPDTPRSPDLDRAFDEHMGEHPLIQEAARTGNGQAHKISDFLSRPGFHDLGLYTEFFRHVDVEHQMAVGLLVRPSIVVGIALSRSLADFTERERLMLDLVRPHLVQSYRNAEAVTALQRSIRLAERAVEECEGGVVVVSPAGRVVLASPSARRWLALYFPAGREPGSLVPDTLARWMRQHHAVAGRDDTVTPPREPFVIDRSGTRLIVRHLCELEACLLLLREQVTVLDPAAFEPLGLTPREAEVLAWLAQGKTNPEIAAILGMRPKTVSKHLERIYPKLGVETRAAAAATAIQTAAGA